MNADSLGYCFFSFFGGLLVFPAFAKATCRSTIRSARGIVNDLGPVAAQQSRGLVLVSTCSEANSERDMHKVLDKFGLGLNIPFTQLPLRDKKVDIPVLRLRDWVSYLLRFNVWHLVCGLSAPDANREKSTLSSFWRKFRYQNPKHPIYELAAQGKISLDRVAPVVLHGDEGRGLKRQAYLVTNYHSLLGRGTNPQRKRMAREKLKKRYIKHDLNFKLHSYCHRFLFGCMPKCYYTNENDDVFRSLLAFAAEEARHMALEGVTHPRTQEQYWVMCVGITGDWPWLRSSGDLVRSFSNVQKRHNVRTLPVGICHLCRGGQVDVPWEQFHTRRPVWYDTMYEQCPFGSPSPFLAVPHIDSEFPGYFKFDVFHIWHLGLGKQLLGNVLALLSERQPAGNVDERFQLLTQEYLAWCQAHKKTPQVKKLTKELITWPTKGHFPVGSWHKGALTTVLLEFVSDHYKNTDFSNEPLLLESMEAVKAASTCLQTMFSHSVFLSNSEAMFIGQMGQRFLRRYASLAEKSKGLGRCLFALQPKGHAWHHLMLDLVLASNQGLRYIVNPLTWSVQLDEDFVGRPSRLSRRVRPGRIQVRRVIQRYLKGVYHQWIKNKLICKARAA